MTLVVSEVSEKFGCVVVGDSAVTIGTKILHGAEKVHYSPDANMGFAIWGNACLAGQRLDMIISSFVSRLESTSTPHSAGQELAALLRSEGQRDGRRWETLRGGIQICGYERSVPVLFHVHTGHEPPEPQGPFQLYEDFPDGRNFCHLRNGYYKMFAPLFDGMQQYAAGLNQLGFKWPNDSIEDRVSYYMLMVETVARTLNAAGRIASVGGNVSAFAFNRDGLQVDKRLPRGVEDICGKGSSLVFF
ncbi:MAG: hypothetical protein ACYC69_01065 [Thermodesulfovibrionales bacterium]